MGLQPTQPHHALLLTGQDRQSQSQQQPALGGFQVNDGREADGMVPQLVMTTGVQLQQCANSVLRAYCGQRGLNTAGNKLLLAQRLACYLHEAGEAVEPLLGPGSRPMVPNG